MVSVELARKGIFQHNEVGRLAFLKTLGLLLAFSALFLSANLNAAIAEDWVVKRVSGTVYFVAPGVDAYKVKQGMVFQKGYTLATRSGRALIARGTETIKVGPNTTFAISKYKSRGQKTTLLQRKGQVDVDVERRGRRHFAVETPFLAAVVKGTQFSVNVDARQARVSVNRGVVGVEDFASGDRADLSAGQSASTNPGRSVGLTVGGATRPTVTRGKPRAPAFETPAVPNVPNTPAEAKAAASSRGNSANAPGQTKSTSNSSSNASANSNAGGNSSNSKAGGNSGNSNSGSGNNNAGGNGNGNSGNSNAGGNGNGNSGNSNAGGNGNGRGNN